MHASAGRRGRTNLAGQEVRLTLLHTADIHSRLIPYDFAPLKTDTDLGLIPEAGPFGGATRIAAILKRERAKADRVLHLDSGDCFQGAPIFNVNNGEVEFRFLSDVRLDAAVIGNHEFDAGALNFVQKARDFATFPLLAANYYWDVPADHQQQRRRAGLRAVHHPRREGPAGGRHRHGQHLLAQLAGGGRQLPAGHAAGAERGAARLRGSAAPGDGPDRRRQPPGAHRGSADLIQGYEAYYEYDRAKPFIERAHNPWKILEWFGPEGDAKSVVRVKIPGVSGIDVILGGHLHVVLNPPQQITDPSGRKVVLSHSGAFAKYVGRLDLVVKVPRAAQPGWRGAGQPRLPRVPAGLALVR